MYKKLLILTLSLTLLALAAVGCTLTWLSVKTDPITDTFTAGDLNLELRETTGTEKNYVGSKVVITTTNGITDSKHGVFDALLSGELLDDNTKAVVKKQLNGNNIKENVFQ